MLKGVRANDLYIVGHPEFREELQELMQEAVDAVPDGEAPEARLRFERMRQQMKAEAGESARAAGDPK